ncbi:YhgE/Pip domain-containing protein [Streptomyces sp. NPDC059063]|uniref:YhgE/Pip domain-containing protein n=1 Tax=unclassified Streptomyces TaxID=2593676 RepID=UPI0036796E7B
MPSSQSPSVLRSPQLWIGTGVIVAVVSTLFALLYVGGNVNPKGHLRDLPVALVNSDRGADAGGKHVNLGDRVVAGIKKSAADDDSIDWQVLSQKEAEKRLGQGKLYGALVVPRDFTAAVAGLTATPQQVAAQGQKQAAAQQQKQDGTQPQKQDSGQPKKGAAAQQKQAARPILTVLTNQAAGSFGSSMASKATQQAAHTASAQIGKELLSRASEQSAQGTKGGHQDQSAQGTEKGHSAQQTPLAPATQLMLADPVSVQVADGHPLGTHSAMGLSAFYYALVLLVCGMLAANVINSQVDTALGYLHTDFGPFRRRMPVRHTSRVRTLAINGALMLGLAVVMGSLVELVSVGILGMDASHLGLLWLYSVTTIAVVGLSALALLAAFGTPGMLVSTIVFVAMAVPSSGATVPLEALPGFFRALAEFEPLRQLTGGMRAILYFDAQGDAGLTRAWASMGIALVVSVLFGLGVTRLYDRKGLHRIPRPAASDS